VSARRLLAWFDANARDLPWRTPAPREAYRVWVSEVMLQQTRVETVVRYYEPFLAAFPDARALAAAAEDEVMKRWEGLGYYRRARLLHAGARVLVERHDGQLPRAFRELVELPGFGPYTAGAVASLAFGERVPAIDGNVLRVVARQLDADDDVGSPALRAKAATWVRSRQPRDAAGAFNEALMELGATVCTPRAPRCGACPLARSCLGRARAAQLPRRSRAAPRVPVARVALALARRGDRVLMEKRERGLLAGTWGLPWVEGSAAALGAHVAALAGGRARVGEVVGRARHKFTHREWAMRAYDVRVTGATRGDWRRLDEVAVAAAHRKVLAAAAQQPL
jgi:A/G-specific adenine glycosylase